jgi:hypothetical protein
LKYFWQPAVNNLYHFVPESSGSNSVIHTRRCKVKGIERPTFSQNNAISSFYFHGPISLCTNSTAKYGKLPKLITCIVCEERASWNFGPGITDESSMYCIWKQQLVLEDIPQYYLAYN